MVVRSQLNYLGRNCLLLVAGVGLLCVAQRSSWCGETPGTLDAYLAAGEFGPALKLASQIEDGAQRDRWLGRIAEAQASIGARQASMSTLLDLQSDVTRNDIAQGIGQRPIGAGGGAAMADFDTLIELITSTIAPTTWDAVGGAGAIEPFPTGVYVDASGVMKRLPPAETSDLLRTEREGALADSGNRDVRRDSKLRKVSLVRLERQLQLQQAFGETPSEAMRNLAGLYRVKYLFVYPDQGEIVLAGPAGDWETDPEGRCVHRATSAPVLRLDDLITTLRNAYADNGKMGCAIKPRQANLAAAKTFLDQWHGKPIRPYQRDRWVADFRQALGKQDIQVWGIDPRTNVARVLIEADYHMKLIGMGLESGTLGVESYLDALKAAAGDQDLPMSVLRWWFTLNYDGVRCNPDRDVFQLDGRGVRVLSENEMLTERGERIHTGKSEFLNAEFAHRFTNHYDALANKYPIYAELRNVFDLAMLCAVMKSEGLPERVDWHMPHFRDSEACRVQLFALPKEVESIVNVVDVSKSRFLAGVSGGVSVDTQQILADRPATVDDYGLLDAALGSATPDASQLPKVAWWWD